MQPGQILVADSDNTHVIKMVGDVRLTLCVSFDKFIDSVFKNNHFCSIVFDLTEASAIDSTTLGLMAKIAILSRDRCDMTPVVFSTNPTVDRLLETMGFEDIFEIIHERHDCGKPCRHLNATDLDESTAKERVLEAHQILMNLNESNRETFRDVVSTLEGC
ncbi:STAS domain-containing protein [Gilvimarinus sp. F26214L]|uniref:STAS domain-containing protein n=1 Tax=Gilvimarinus sp. DZF01 TaxID=3461371 RepID=UPI0040467449